MQRLAAGHAVLAFDLDGTLAPITGHPQDARVAPATAARLHVLSQRWPVAVITGRSVADASTRLGFTPRYLYGNHGAEYAGALGGLGGRWLPESRRLQRQLEPCRQLWQSQADQLHAQRIGLEDKGLSLALHYRHATDPQRARRWLDHMLAPLATAGTGLHAAHGHLVLNITPAGAPDKGDALLAAMRHCGARRALVVGDDVNDECAFAKAPSGSVSVRIGTPQTPTLAQFRLSLQAQIDVLLGVLLGLLPK